MFYNVYKDLREKRPFPHMMSWTGYKDKNQAIKNARMAEKGIFNNMLVYVKTIETISPYEHYDGIALSIYDKDRIWNQTLPEVHFYDAGRTQYR